MHLRKRVLVTGGAGFLGSHLCERLLAEECYTHSRSEIIFRPLPEDDPLQRCPDISLAKERLAWEPRVPLAKGLEKTIRYFTDFAGRFPGQGLFS